MRTAFRDPADRLINSVAILVVIISLVVTVGWLGDIPLLRTFTPVWGAMAPLTPVLLILLSTALVLRRRDSRWADPVMLACTVIAAVVMIEQLYYLNLGTATVSQLIDQRAGAPLPELPDLETASATLILVAAMLCWRTKHPRLHDVGDVLMVFIGLVCLQVILAYGYSVLTTESWRGFRQIAPHTTLSVMMLALSATALRPTLGLYGATRGAAQSALQLRRLLPATIAFCVVLGLLYLMAIEARIDAIPSLVAWTVVAAVTGLGVLIFITSADMRHVETTIRHRQEELIAAMRAAESGSDAKSRFMRVMSHELRTPLTAIIGYANLLDEGIAGEQSAEARNYVDRIRASGWHLVGLIDAVLLYSSGEASADELRLQRVDVGELATRVAETFEGEADKRGITLRVATQDGAWVIADLRKLRQMMINLLSNAVKFTDRGGIDLRVYVRNETVVTEVADTGIGIGAAQMDTIWEPFNLGDASHTRTRGGMGMGLPLTRKMADQIGAQLTARSSPGGGSTFTIEMPLAQQQDERAIGLNGARVLVVDDEAGVRRIMVRTLTRYGGEVTQAESAYEALNRIGVQDNFDVVVTDISMPGMTGIELARQLHTRRFGSPILFVTGAELDVNDHAEIARLGGQLLRKPFDMIELVRAVQLMAEGRN